MNKQAQFYSLTAVLLIIILLALTQAQFAQTTAQEETRVHTAQTTTLNHFAKNFDTLEIPLMLRQSTQQALAKEGPYSPQTLAEEMNQGDFGVEEHIEIIQKTLGFTQPDQAITLQYTLTQVKQINSYEVELIFETNHTITNQQTTYTRENQQRTITIHLNGAIHPGYDQNQYDIRINQDNWKERTDMTCAAQHLFTGVDIECNDQPGIAPPGYEGD